jgi:hypothetical protein
MLKYYLKDGSREKGPFMLDDLKYQRIRPNTLVKLDGGEWKPIAEVHDLAFLLKLDDHTHSSASFAKPDQHEPYGNPEQQAKKRAAIVIAVAVFFVILGAAFAVFFNVSNR